MGESLERINKFVRGGKIMSYFYNRKGEKITMDEWTKLTRLENYPVIKQDHLKYGLMVSTVWLGLNHRFPQLDQSNSKPIIFETIILLKSGLNLGCERASTEEDALKNHSLFLRKAKKIKIEDLVLEEL